MRHEGRSHRIRLAHFSTCALRTTIDFRMILRTIDASGVGLLAALGQRFSQEEAV